MSNPPPPPPAIPLFDPTRLRIKNIEAWNYLKDIGGGGSSLTKILEESSVFPLNITTRRINGKKTRNPNAEISLRSYDLSSITYKGVNYALPKIELIDFSPAEMERYNTAIALIKYASANNLDIPELSRSLAVLNSLISKGYEKIVLFDAGLSTSSEAGGQVNLDKPGAPLLDK